MARSSYVYVLCVPDEYAGYMMPVITCTVKKEFIGLLKSSPEEWLRDGTAWRLKDGQTTYQFRLSISELLGEV